MNRGVFLEREHDALLREKNLKNSKLPTFFYLHFTDNGYINV